MTRDHNEKNELSMRDATRGTSRWSALSREPLVHFLLLGLLLFALDRLLHPAVADNHVIVVSKAMRQSIIDNYDEDKARAPSDAELKAALDNWVGEEILYREGKAMGLDQGDATIRDRIIYKLRVMVGDEAKVADPDDATLKAWFEAHRDRYDEPDRLSFFVTPPVDRPTAERELADIRAQRESQALRDASRLILDRPIGTVEKFFGKPFAEALRGAKLGEWQVVQANESPKMT